MFFFLVDAALVVSLNSAAGDASLVREAWSFIQDDVWTLDASKSGTFCFADATDVSVAVPGPVGRGWTINIEILGQSPDRGTSAASTWWRVIHHEPSGTANRMSWRGYLANFTAEASKLPFPTTPRDRLTARVIRSVELPDFKEVLSYEATVEFRAVAAPRSAADLAQQLEAAGCQSQVDRLNGSSGMRIVALDPAG